MYGIRVKIFELLELLDIVGFIVCICFMDIVAWAKEAVFIHTCIYCIYWTVWDRYMQVLFLGRAPRTKETLPDFLKWRRVTRPPLVFRGLTGSQRTPGFWGVTFFIDYPLASKGFRFYCPGHHTRIVESLNAKFLEDHIDSSSSQASESLSTQSSVDPIILPIMQERIITIPVQGEGFESGTVAPDSTVVNENTPEIVELEPIQPMPLRRSQRERRSALPDDYVVYSGEVDYDIGQVIDPVTFLDDVHSPQYDKWNIAMKEEMLSMVNNDVWELVEMP